MGVSENCGGTGANDGRGQTRNAMGCLDKSQRAQNWAAIMCADERLVTCVLAAPAVRFGVRRPGPPSSPMDFSARDRSDLLFGVFLARLSDPWIDWTAGNAHGLFCLLSLVRERGARFFRLPIRWNAAGGRLHFAVPGAAGIAPALG